MSTRRQQPLDEKLGVAMRPDSIVTDHTASESSQSRVIRFPGRVGGGASVPHPAWNDPSVVADLAGFERTPEQDDYRHRMIVNAIAVVFTVALMAAGMWIADSMAMIQKNQDCALMGRHDCAPISVPTNDRW